MVYASIMSNKKPVNLIQVYDPKAVSMVKKIMVAENRPSLANTVKILIERGYNWTRERNKNLD